MSKSSVSENIISEELIKVVKDFVKDIITTFPEVKDDINDQLKDVLLHKTTKEIQENINIKMLYKHINNIYPERFFDILYKNEEIFKEKKNDEDDYEEINTYFLPGLNFKKIWHCSYISDQTKETIWKYLQLILFSVVNNVNSQDSFGDTAKLFEAINEDELKEKLEETMKHLQDVMGSETASEGAPSMEGLPNPEDIQGHINGLLNGKLGQLAQEIAEETAGELNIDTENASSVNDVFQKLFKNPTKIMGLVKSVGSKLDDKIKAGDIKESEIMQEATEMLNKMKDMPGMGNIQSMLKKMGMPNMPGMGKGKVNVGAMQSALNQNLKKAQRKEKMLKQLDERKKQELLKKQQPSVPEKPDLTDEQIEELIFSIEGDKPEKSSRVSNNTNKKKKKKGKKK